MSFLSILGAITKPILGPLFGIIDQAVTDKDKAAELKQEVQMAVLSIQEKTLESQKDVIIAEAQGDSWLQRTWRPMFMVLLMSSMIVSVIGGMLGYGANIASGWDSINDSAWLLMQIGLGGYIGGRTIEKTAKTAIKWNSERKT